MGWWKNDALNALLGRKLTLAELLGYLHLVLGAKSRDLLAAHGSLAPLVADIEIFGDDDPTAHTVEMATADDPTIRQHVDAMCADISGLYEAFQHRRPTLAEMLESIRFPLDKRLVELPGDADVKAIRIL